MISPNVLITRDFDTMQRVFFGPSNMGGKLSFSDRLEDVRNDKNTLLAAPGVNNTLLELDFNIPQGSQSQSYINAKFVESHEIIEYFALNASPLETQFNTIYSLFSKAGVSLDESLAKLNKFYIAFGTGDDMNEWAGPFAVTLGTANMVLDNNVKVVTLGFVVGELTSVRSYTQKLYGNLGFEDENLNTSLPKDTKVRYKFVEELDYGLTPTKGPRRNPSQRDNTKRVFQKPFTWNPFIRRLLKGYLGKVYGGSLQSIQNRVMVLLSEDFDEIISKDLEETESKDFFRNFGPKLRKMGIGLKARSPSAPTKSSSRNKTSYGKAEIAEEAGFLDTISEYNPFSSTARKAAEVVNNAVNARAEAQQADLNTGDYGTEYNLSEREIDFIRKQENRLGDDGKRFSTLEKYYTDYYKKQGDSQATKEKKTDYMELIDSRFLLTKAIMEMEMDIDSDPDEKTPDRVLHPIFKFIGALKEHTGSTKDYCIYELADQEIISFLDKAMKNGGMSYPGGGPGTPRIIFGDTRLIKKLIYLADQGKSNLSGDKTIFGKMFTDPELDRMDWEGYREDFKSTILERERRQNSSFKEQIDFGPFNSTFQEIKNEKDIIFLHGVKNSNVLSISFQKDIVQGPLLNFNMSARQRGPFLNSFIKKAVKNDDFKVKDLVDYFKDKGLLGEDATLDSAKLQNFILSMNQEEAASLSSIEQKTGTNFLAKGRTGSAEDLDNYVSLIVGYFQLLEQYSEDLPNAEIPYLSDNSTDNPRAYQTMADLHEKMSNLVVNLNIKTLPFFNQKFYFDKQCYLFSLYNNVITTTNDIRENPPSTILNGNYLIRGARHFLSAKEAFSEFDLVKTKPEKDVVDPPTEKAVKSATPPEAQKEIEGNAPPAPGTDRGTKISKPITPNPGGERFPGRPATGETSEQNKLKRQKIAKKKRAQNSKQNPNEIKASINNGVYQIEVPPALTQERQNQLEEALKNIRDAKYAQVQKGVKNRDAKMQRRLRKADMAAYQNAKRRYDVFMRTKKNNNGVIPTYNVSGPPLR